MGKQMDKKMDKKFEIPGMNFDAIDLDLVLATQAGMPIVNRPYLQIAEKIGISEGEVLLRLKKMKDFGFIRKIAAAPNHYKLGYVANAMTVWDVPEDKVEFVGNIFKSVGFISHCYIRPRALPQWRYNLFAMVHGKNKEEVSTLVSILKNKIENNFEEVELIFSSKILKKTGVRLKAVNDV